MTLSEHASLGGSPLAGVDLELGLFRLSDETGAAVNGPAGGSAVNGAGGSGVKELFHGAAWLTDGPAAALPPAATNLLLQVRIEPLTLHVEYVVTYSLGAATRIRILYPAC